MNSPNIYFIRINSTSNSTIEITMSQTTVVLKVGMSCGGCAGAVKRVLTNMEGVETFDIDLEQKKVTVKGNVDPDAVFQTVSKTGKKTEFWPKEASPCCCGPKKPAEPAVLAEPIIEAVEPVTAPSSGVEKPVVAPPSCEATKPIEPVVAPPSSEVEKPVEPVVAPFSKAEKTVESTVV